MAGGGGTRLWPASTPDRPKQLMALRPDDSSPATSLLGATIDRLEGVVDPARAYVVATKDQVEPIRRAVPSLGEDQIIAEPFGRNTAPCIALAVKHLRARLGAKAEEATLIALPADHDVTNAPAFRAHIACASAHAEAADVVVTLGIEPDRPETGYGYIERGREPLEAVPGDEGIPVFTGLRFVEKPDLERAREFLEAGCFLWNAGIFVMPLGRIAAEFERHCASTWAALEPVQAALLRGAEEGARATEEAYAKIEPAPIDIAVMEKITDLRVVPASVGWFDLGSWQSVHMALEQDADENVVVRGNVTDTRESLVWNDDPNVEVNVLGMTGVAVVASAGKVLVLPLERAQDVRGLAKADARKRR
jgi:mannose-1-phosphate guanylyltransferase